VRRADDDVRVVTTTPAAVAQAPVVSRLASLRPHRCEISLH
jgi:hypothetical protein